MNNVQVVILAGGQGARFWPMSRICRPKQFLSISENGESLIQATARRIKPMSGEDRLWVMTNIMHEALIREHVPYSRIVSEPLARNTAPSIGLAAIHARRIDPRAVMVVLPADHAVQDEERLRQVLQMAIDVAAKHPMLVTVGIQPSFAHTGYGYIKRGEKLHDSVYRVARFFEKPNAERAKKYYESGEYFWNSGMFVWRVDVLLKAIADYMPDLMQGLTAIEAAIGTKEEADVVRKVFDSLETISIDFGVLEHASNSAVITANGFGWNDVGSWDAWATHFDHDAEGNLVHGDALMIESKHCVVQSEGRLIAVLGADNLIVIDAGDALLICPRERVQDVRKIVNQLKAKGRTELI